MRVGPGLIGAVVLIVGLFATGRIVAWWLNRAEEITERQRLIYKLLVVVPVIFIWGVPLWFAVYPVRYPPIAGGSPIATALLNSGVAALVVVCGLTAALRGLRPFTRTRPMIEGELWRRGRQIRFFLIGVICFAAVTIELSFLLSYPTAGLIFGVLVSGAGWAMSVTVSLPFRPPNAAFGVRRPSETERERIERVYERLDIPLPDGIEITVDDDAGYMTVLQTGDKRVLALSDVLLSQFDNDTLSIGIAYAEGEARHEVDFLHRLHTYGAWWMFVVLCWFLLMEIGTPIVTKIAVIGALLLVVILGLINEQIARWGRERIRLTDEYMCDHTDVDPATLIELYRTPDRRVGVVSKEWEIPSETLKSLTFEPTIEDRLNHLGLGESSSDG